MYNYTSKTQKIVKYSEKYNLSEERISYILNTHEDLLTLNELKIKYDNPNIGVFPEWLDFESLDSMIWKSIHQCWGPILEIEYQDKNDLYNDLYIYLCKKSNLIKNFCYAKGMIVQRILTIIDTFKRRYKYMEGSLDEVNDFDLNKSNNARQKIQLQDTVISNSEQNHQLVESINDIKDVRLRSLLVVTGYLICNIAELRSSYLDLLKNCDDSIKKDLIELEERVVHNDKIENLKKFEGVKIERKKNITVYDICKILQLKIFKPSNGKGKKQQLQNFLNQNDIKGVILGV